MTRLGVCSWSLQPESAHHLAERIRAAGLGAVQLALDPLRLGIMPVEQVLDAFADPPIGILSGMMAMAGEDYTTIESIRRTGGLVPDETWETNLAAARDDAALAGELGLELVSFHAGFIPHDTGSSAYGVMLERLRTIASVFAERGVRVALETGQESAAALQDLLTRLDTPSVGVNFDPANMVLYGTGDPVEALQRLRSRVVQVHIKDALPASRTGTWGREVPAGVGAVDWGAFFEILRAGSDLDLVIEREAGDQRVVDVQVAAALVRAYGMAG